MPKPRKNSGSEPPFNPAALRVMMERTLGGLGQNKLSDEARAQELVYNAMEASSWERCMRLVRQALELDPENVDALLMLLGAADFKGEERVEVLHGIVATGAKRLGKKAFKELVPHFWGFIETRPYMRGRLDEARALMERFKGEGEWSVVFAWGRVLERLLSGDKTSATKALALARKQNAHMEAYLKGHRKLPKNLPASYSPGSKEEALCYADLLMAAWKAHPAAVTWLGLEGKPGDAPAKVEQP